VRSLVPDANPAAARLAIAAEVYHDNEDHLTAAKIPPQRALQRRHNNGHGATGDFLARACGIPRASLADRAGSCLAVERNALTKSSLRP
jgi:hypothetical protein